MIELGKYNNLRIVKAVEFGLYLDGGVDGEILMPTKYVPENAKPEDYVEVFIYLDSEDRPIATTETPLAQVGDFACLRCVALTPIGAFLDWGLLKDLLVPFREQKLRMMEDGMYIVYVYEDKASSRIVASAKIDKFLDKSKPSFEFGEKVDLLICQRTDLGYKAIINNKFSGILYENEVFRRLELGERTTGYIKQVREDYKIDLLLEQPGYEKVGGIAEEILKKLQDSNGFIAVTDKSEAEYIYELFGVSKKTYKKAVGDLFRKRLIFIEEKGIRLHKT